jgi:hypothetical protein
LRDVLIPRIGKDFRITFGGRSTCTDGKNIFVADLPDSADADARIQAEVSAYHEAEHVRVIQSVGTKGMFKGAKTWKDISDKFMQGMNTQEKKVMRDLVNIFEDIRIDKEVCERYPGCVEKYRQSDINTLKRMAPHIATNPLWFRATCLAIFKAHNRYFESRCYSPTGEDKLFGDDANKAYEVLFSQHEKAIDRVSSLEAVISLSKKILPEVLKNFTPPPPQPQPPQESDSESGDQKDQEQESSGAEGSSKAKEDSGKEDSESEGQDARNKESEGGDSEESAESSKKDATEEDSGEDAKEAEGESSEEKESPKEDGEDTPAEPEGTQKSADPGEEQGDSETGDTKEDESEEQGDSETEEDESEEQSDSETEDTKEDESEEQGDSETGDTKEDESEEQSDSETEDTKEDESEGTDTGEEGSAEGGSGEGVAEEGEPTGNTGTSPVGASASAEDSSEEASTSEEDAGEPLSFPGQYDASELEAEALDISSTRMQSINTVAQEYYSVNPLVKDIYVDAPILSGGTDWLAQGRPYFGGVEAKIRHILLDERAPKVIDSLPRGKHLDTRHLYRKDDYRLGKQPTIWETRLSGVNIDTALHISVDGSGSMILTPRRWRTQMAILASLANLLDTCSVKYTTVEWSLSDNKVAWGENSHQRTAAVTYRRFSQWGERLNPHRIPNAPLGGYTPTADIIPVGLEELSARSEVRKALVMFTDGGPYYGDHSYNGPVTTAAVAFAEEQMGKARAQGFKTFGFGIDIEEDSEENTIMTRLFRGGWVRLDFSMDPGHIATIIVEKLKEAFQ